MDLDEFSLNAHPGQVLKQLTWELRHFTSMIIGCVGVLQEYGYREEMFDRVLNISQLIKTNFVIDKYLDSCKPNEGLPDEDFEADKTALSEFIILFRHHLQAIETLINFLQQSDMNSEQEFESGLAQMRQLAETLEDLRSSTFNNSSWELGDL